LKKIEIKVRTTKGSKAEVYNSIPDLMIALKTLLPLKVHMIIKCNGTMTTEEFFDIAYYETENDRIRLACILQSQINRQKEGTTEVPCRKCGKHGKMYLIVSEGISRVVRFDEIPSYGCKILGTIECDCCGGLGVEEL